MFKENYIKKLAFDNIRRQKRIYKYMFMTLVLSFFLTTFMFIIVSSSEKISYIERAGTFGKWSVAVENDVREQVIIDQNYDQGKVYFLSEVYDHERQIGKLGAMDERGYELANLQLVDGRYPLNSQEVIIEESQCQYLGILDELNQIIEIEFNEDGKNVLKKMKLVGILKDYSNVYPIEMPTFITQEISHQYTLLLNDDKPLNVFNYFVESYQEQYVVNNFYTYNSYGWDGNQYADYSFVDLMQGVIVFIGFLGILVTTLSSMHKRTEYLALMRALGMTRQQIQEMILYEGFLLMIVGGAIGTLSGVIISIVSIIIYHLTCQVPFYIEMDSFLLLSLLLTSLLGYLSMVIGSLSLFKISLNIKQFINKPKHRRVRKLNMISLAIQEITSRKKVFCLLSILVSIIIMFCSVLFSQWNTFSQNTHNDFGFSHQLYGESLTNEDFDKIASIDGLNPLFMRYHSVRVHTRGLESWDSSEHYKVTTTQLPYQYWMPHENIMAFEKNNFISEILMKQNLKGRMPETKYETIAIVPYIDFDTNRTSFKPLISESLEQRSIQIGDVLDLAELSNDEVYSHQLHVVGVITYKVDDKKMDDLTSNGGYQFIVTPATFTDLFKNTDSQSIYITTMDKQLIRQLKSEVYTILKSRNDVVFNDYISMELILNMQMEKDFIKSICFISIFIISASFILYMQRKISSLSMKHEIGLMKALGLTHNQFILIYLIYDILVYIMGTLLIIIVMIVINLNDLERLGSIMIQNLFNLSYIMTGVLVMIIMIWPFFFQKNKSVIELLNYKE